MGQAAYTRTRHGTMRGLWAALGAATALPHGARADFLNEYLNDKTFGANPGPCPTYADKCTGDWQNLPDSVKQIQVCLLNNNQNGCGTIGNLVKAGRYEIWALQCSKIAIGDISLAPTLQSLTQLQSAISVKQFKLGCNFMVNLFDLTLEIGGLFRVITSVLNTQLSFPYQGYAGAVDAGLQLNLLTSPGQKFDSELPGKVTLPASQCKIGVNLGLNLRLDQIDNLQLCASIFGTFQCATVISSGKSLSGLIINALLALFNIDAIISAIVRVLEAVIGGIVCSVIEQLAVLKDGSNGAINVFLTQAKTTVDKYAADGAALVLSPAAEDAQAQKYAKSAAEVAASTDFGASTVAEAVSVALNGWLGAKSTTPGFNGLVFNELVNAVTEPDGYAALDLVAAGLAPQATLPLNVTDLTVRLNSFALAGANSFTSLALLQNNYNSSVPTARMRYTFQNKLAIDQLSFDVNIFTNLAPGAWVSAGTAQSRFTFTFSITLRQLLLDAYSLILWNFANIRNVQVGQLTGLSVDASGSLSSVQAQVQDALQCVAPALYALSFTELRASVGQVGDAVMKDFSGNGLSALIQQATNLIGKALQGALKAKLPGLSRGIIRTTLNDLIVKYVTDPGRAGTNKCPAWKGAAGSTGVPVNFKSGLFAGTASLINESVGGNPIKASTFDINQLVATLLRYFSTNYAAFPVQALAGAGDYGLKPLYTNNLKATAFQRPGDHIYALDLQLLNVDSVYRLTASPVAEGSFGGVGVSFGIGGLLLGQTGSQPLTLAVAYDVVDGQVGASGTRESGTVGFALSNVVFQAALSELWLDLDFLNALSLAQATGDLTCLLGVPAFIRFSRSAALRQVQVGGVAVSLANRNAGSPPSRLKTALDGLAGPVSARLVTLTNTVLLNGMGLALDAVQALPDNYDTAITPKTCSGATSPIASLTSLATRLPNVTQLVETCTATVNYDQPAIGQMEALVKYDAANNATYDLRDSALLRIVQDLLAKALANGGADALLRNFANQTGSLLSSVFQFDPADKTKVNIVLPLGALGVTLANNALIPGLVVSAGNLTLKAANKLLNNINLLDVIGKFTTRNTINFTAAAGQPATRLDVSLQAFVEMDRAALDGAGATGKVREALQVDFVMENFYAQIDLLTALNASAVGEKSLGHFVRVDEQQTVFIASSLPDCILDIFFQNGLALRKLQVEVGAISSIAVTSPTREILSSEASNVFQAVTEIVVDFYKNALGPILQNCVRTYLNQYSAALRTQTACPAFGDIPAAPLTGRDQIFRFNTSSDLAAVQGLWSRYVIEDNYVNLNTVLDAALSNSIFFNSATNNNFAFSGIPIAYLGKSYGSLDLGLANVQLSKVAVSSLRLLQPFRKGDLPAVAAPGPGRLLSAKNAELTPENVGYVTLTQIKTSPAPLGLQADIVLNARGLFADYPDMKNNVRVKLDVSQLLFGLQLLLEINVTEALRLQLKSVGTLSQLPCLLVPVKALQPQHVNISMAALAIEASCIDRCDLPFFKALGDGTFKSQNGAEVAALIERAVNFTGQYLASINAQAVIDAQLAVAARSCQDLLNQLTGLIQPFQPFDNVASYMGFSFAGVVFVAILGYGLVYPVHNVRRKQLLLQHLSECEKDIDAMAGADKSQAMAQVIYATEMSMKSIFSSPKVPTWAKFAVPLVTLLNILLLVIAVAVAGAMSLVIKVTLLGADTVLWEIVPITIASLINTMSAELSIVVGIVLALACGVIPLASSLGVLLVWFTPATVMAEKYRRQLIVTLELTGKIGFILVFVLAVLIAALYTVANVADYRYLTFLPGNVAKLEINVLPKTGMIWLGIGASINLMLAHLASYYDSKAANYTKKVQDVAAGLRASDRADGAEVKLANVQEAVQARKFLGTDREGRSRELDPRKVKALVGAAAAALLLLAIGVFVPVITFSIEGIAGVLLREISAGSPTLEQPLNLKTFSLVQIGAAMKNAPRDNLGAIAGVIFVQLLYFFVFILAPIISLGLAIFVLVQPLRLRSARFLYWVHGICIYWGGADIALLTLVLLLLLISPLITIYINFVSSVLISQDFCDTIKPALGLLGLDPKDQYCMNVTVFLDWKLLFLILGVLLHMAVSFVFSVITGAVLADRYYAAYHNVRSDAKPRKLSRLAIWVLSKVTIAGPPSADAGSRPDTLRSAPSVFNPAEDDEAGFCSALCRYWSTPSGRSNMKGDTDERLDDWRKRFTGAVEASRSSSDNPIYSNGRTPFDAFGSPGSRPSRPAPSRPNTSSTEMAPAKSAPPSMKPKRNSVDV